MILLYLFLFILLFAIVRTIVLICVVCEEIKEDVFIKEEVEDENR